MKNNRYFLSAAAVLALAACAKEAPLTTAPEKTEPAVSVVTFEASMPETKAVMGVNADNKRQVFWENGDQITVYSKGVSEDSTTEGFVFTTSLTDNATSATFSYTGNDFVTGDYMAIYPASTEARRANFAGTDIYKMAAVDVPSDQTLVAGSFDKSAAVMTAFAPEGSSSLSFKNAVALLKFQVSEANIVSGRIVVDDHDKISGRFRADLSTTAPYEPTLSVYSAADVVQYNFVDFSLGGTTALATGTDYYVAVRPTALTSGFKVYLNGNLVKSFTTAQVAELKRNKVYNLGTLSVPANPTEKILYFDFTSEPPTGGDPAWPTNETKANYPHVEGGETFSYLLYGTKYSFVLADCGGATNTSANVFWHTSTKALVFNAQKRYLGFPAIDGYKLTEIVCSNRSGTTTAKFEVVKSISTTTDHPADSEIVSAAQVWTTKGIDYTYTISNPAASTRYYLYCLVKGSVGAFKLTYVKAE